MDTATITQLKKQLEQQREELKERLASVARQSSSKEGSYTADFPKYGDKPEENATEVADFQDNLSIESELADTLNDVHAALKRIEEGTYGTCENCGETIAPQRLQIMPSATRCMKCHAA